MHGLYLLYWVQEKQVSPAIVAAGLVAGDVAVALFEIPTGWIADRWGPRRSLITGSLAQVAGMLACWFAPGVYSVIAGTLAIALGDAFRSGANQALLYRSCVALDRVDDFRRIEASTHAATQVALVLLVLAGGAIVQQWGFAAGWFAETLLSVLGVICAVSMTVPPDTDDSPSDDRAEALAPTWTPLLARRLLLTALPASLVGAAASAASFVAQTRPESSLESVTWLVAALALVEAGGSIVSRPGLVTRPSLLLLAAAGVVGVTAFNSALVPMAALTLSLLEGVAYPGRAAAIQAMATDAIRGRAASFASLCDMAVNAGVLTAIGGIRSRRRRQR
jgi:MFS family permease